MSLALELLLIVALVLLNGLLVYWLLFLPR